MHTNPDGTKKKDWLTERKPKFQLTFVKDLQHLPNPPVGIAKASRSVRKLGRLLWRHR